jgi:GNAT superfamily N-acetyltransferase
MDMQVGSITQDNLTSFRTLLLPEAVDAIASGEPLTALALVRDGVACGAAAGYLTETCFDVISLYVAPGYRRKGGGRLLIETFVAILRSVQDIATHSIEINYTVIREDHEELAPFLAALKFTLSKDDVGLFYRCSVGELATAQFFAGHDDESDAVQVFAKVPKEYLVNASQHALAHDVPLPKNRLESDQTEKDVSVCVIEDNAVVAFLSFDFSCGGILTLTCAYSEKSTLFPSLARKACHALTKKYPPETPFVMQVLSQISADLLHTILPMAVPISFNYSLELEEK